MDTETSPHRQESVLENKAVRSEVNAYPTLRKIFFSLVILFFVVIAVFLVYQNGKSIYDNGI